MERADEAKNGLKADCRNGPVNDARFIISPDQLILVTGATGFMGPRVVRALLNLGFRNIRCLARPSSSPAGIDSVLADYAQAKVEILRGNLLSRGDCLRASEDAAVILHLAAARGEKSFPDAFMNSVVTTRNLLDASRAHGCLTRFVSISSFAVYANVGKRRWRLLDESCPVEPHPELRGQAYTFAKVKQDEIVQEYGRRFGVPFVIVRPGYVYGAGNESITNRVGIGTFGVFLHLGGSNHIPCTFVDNCADAIALASVRTGIDGHVFNIVDDDLPSSRQFLRLYKRHVRRFRSIYLPHGVSYLLCGLWEKYSAWSEGQLPPIYNRRTWHAVWKSTRYSNQKAKTMLGWSPRVSTARGLELYFRSCREGGLRA
jgi:nucleoside-diphosphate-sugar epimerase